MRARQQWKFIMFVLVLTAMTFLAPGIAQGEKAPLPGSAFCDHGVHRPERDRYWVCWRFC